VLGWVAAGGEELLVPASCGDWRQQAAAHQRKLSKVPGKPGTVPSPAGHPAVSSVTELPPLLATQRRVPSAAIPQHG